MYKLKETLLMLCFILSGALCYASGIAGTKYLEAKGIPIVVKECISASGSDRSNSILPVLNGHVLIVSFTENLGQVTIEITTVSGAPVDCLTMSTPNGYQFYIANTGDYIVTFTLPNGDEYYGEFSIIN